MSCAATDTENRTASQVGKNLDRLCVIGSENSSNPAVAETERIIPKSIESQGSHMRRNSDATAKIGTPEDGLPR